MNRFHRWYCGSGHWRRHLTGGILPLVVEGQDLGATLPARLTAAGFRGVEVGRESDFFTFRAQA